MDGSVKARKARERCVKLESWFTRAENVIHNSPSLVTNGKFQVSLSHVVHNIFESDYTGAKFYYQMPFISSSELCSRIKALYRKTLHLNNPFQYFYSDG